MPAALRTIFEPGRVRPRLAPCLTLAFVAMALIAAWFLLMPLFGPAAHLGYYRPVPNRLPYGYNWALLLAFVPYGLALAAWWRGERVAFRVLLGGAIVLHVLLLFAPPPQSQDLYQYLFYGHMQAVSGLNPYVFQPVHNWQDPWYAWIRWPTQTSVYGPVWSLISFGVAKLAGSSLTLAFAIYKLFILAIDLSIMWLIVRIARTTPNPSRAAGWGILVYAWNPLVMITVPLGGAADAAIAAALLGAILARRSGRTWLATILLTLATLVKLYAGIGLLLHLILLARERHAGRALLHAAAAAALAVVTFLPYAGGGLGVLDGIVRVSRLVNDSVAGTLQEELTPALSWMGVPASGAVAGTAVRWLGAVVLAAAIAWAIRQVRSENDLWYATAAVMLVYSLVTPWFLYWYILAPLTILAVLPRNRLTFPVLTFSGTALFTLSFPPWFAGKAAQAVVRYGPPAVVFFRHRSSSRSSDRVAARRADAATGRDAPEAPARDALAET